MATSPPSACLLARTGLIAATAVLLLAACTRGFATRQPAADPAQAARLSALEAQVARLSQRVTDLERKQPTLTTGYVLTTTWIVPNQPPSSTQLTFQTPALACDLAREQTLEQGGRLAQETADKEAQSASGGPTPKPPPQVVATCVASDGSGVPAASTDLGPDRRAPRTGP